VYRYEKSKIKSKKEWHAATKPLNDYSVWAGVEHGAGAGDPPAAHGQGGHLPPHLLLPTGIPILFPFQLVDSSWCRRSTSCSWTGRTPATAPASPYRYSHGLINYLEIKAKYRHLRKLTCNRTLRQVFISLRPSPLLWPLTPPLHTVYLDTVTYSHREGGGELTREKVPGATLHKAGSDCISDLQSIDSDKHMPQSPFSGQFF
jgi:hypothetical protein